MVWSISKDDDGLEPALPRAGYGTDGESDPHRSSTVVVDPVSQIPEPMPNQNVQRSSRRAEPTRILSARKMDQLRAQVAKHQRRQDRRKWIRLVTWGAAGALAVALGGITAGGVLPRLDAQLWQRLLAQFGGTSQVDKAGTVKSLPALMTPTRSVAAPPQVADGPPHEQVPARPVAPRRNDATRAVSLDELEAEDEASSNN